MVFARTHANPLRPAEPRPANAVVYPESDGQPMAENTLQFDWIVRLVDNLDAIRPDFVAGDLFWYPVEGDPRTRVAPDVLVVPGRPKGHRGSYRQWEEGGVAPAVVVEVISPGNNARELMRKGQFYQRHGVSEFIVVDPEGEDGWAFLYDPDGGDTDVETIVGWTSPTLGIRFDHDNGRLVVAGPDGRRFERIAGIRAELDAARSRAEHEAQRAERLAARLRELGIDPEG